MGDPTPERDRWTFDGRHFLLTKFSEGDKRDGYGFELEEVSPPSPAIVLEAFWDDTTGLFTFRAFTERSLPFRLVEQFVADASTGVPPKA